MADLFEKEKHQKNHESIFTEDDINYVNRVVCLLLYETSYFSETYENMLSKPVVKFMIR